MPRPTSFLGSVSDLMAGLMIVFLFIAVSYMVESQSNEKELKTRAAEAEVLNIDLQEQRNRLEESNEIVKRITSTYVTLQRQLYEDLKNEFGDDLLRWGASLERDSTVRFNEPDILFGTGSTDINPKFQSILENFFPRYLSVIYQDKFRSRISEIRIEGHTSTMWEGANNENERYLRNAELSQRRALSVLSFCYSLCDQHPQKRQLIKNFRANGVSFADPIYSKDGTEDASRSRRVDFRILTSTQKQIDEIIKATEIQ